MRTTIREANVSCWATNSWRAWEAIGLGEESKQSVKKSSLDNLPELW